MSTEKIIWGTKVRVTFVQVLQIVFIGLVAVLLFVVLAFFCCC